MANQFPLAKDWSWGYFFPAITGALDVAPGTPKQTRCSEAFAALEHGTEYSTVWHTRAL